MPVDDAVDVPKAPVVPVIEKEAAGEGEAAFCVGIDVFAVIFPLRQRVINVRAVHGQLTEHLRIKPSQFLKGQRIVFRRAVRLIERAVRLTVQLR